MDIVEFAEKYFPKDRHILEHTKPWIELYDNNKFSIVLAAREHTKSTTIRMWLLHALCENPSLRVLIAAHKEELADEFFRDIQMQLERDDIQSDFGFKKGKPWNIGQAFLTTAKLSTHSTATLSTVAKLAGVTGKRFDIIVMDDILTVENQGTENRRRKLRRWINTELYPALDSVEGSKWIVIGTRKNVEDWYSEIMAMSHWNTIVDQLYKIDDEGNKIYLWPDRFNEDVEVEKRAQMESDEFAMEFMNQPVASEGLRFKRKWIKFYGGTSGVSLPHEKHMDIYMGIDPSGGKKGDRTSYSAIVVIAFDKRPEYQDIYVLDMVRSRLSLAEQEDIIEAKYNEWQPHRVNIEGVLYNQTFAERMVRTFPRMHRVSYMHTGMRGTTDTSKIGRIENIVGWLFKKGKIYLKDPVIDPMTKTFIEHEYAQFPEGKMDLLDALNMAVDQVDLRRVITSNPVKLF